MKLLTICTSLRYLDISGCQMSYRALGAIQSQISLENKLTYGAGL